MVRQTQPSHIRFVGHVAEWRYSGLRRHGGAHLLNTGVAGITGWNISGIPIVGGLSSLNYLTEFRDGTFTVTPTSLTVALASSPNP